VRKLSLSGVSVDGVAVDADTLRHLTGSQKSGGWLLACQGGGFGLGRVVHENLRAFYPLGEIVRLLGALADQLGPSLAPYPCVAESDQVERT